MPGPQQLTSLMPRCEVLSCSGDESSHERMVALVHNLTVYLADICTAGYIQNGLFSHSAGYE